MQTTDNVIEFVVYHREAIYSNILILVTHFGEILNTVDILKYYRRQNFCKIYIIITF